MGWCRRVCAAILVLTVWSGAGLAPVDARAQAPSQTEDLRFDVQTVQIETTGGTRAYRVEMALTPAQRERGLMHRTSLPAGHGMLFDFGSVRDVAMWMKNTLISLDMLFITEDGRIARIDANAEPQSLTIRRSGVPVRAVLELPGGEAARAGIAVGDRLIQPMFRPTP
ncbi:DUF192 domain-containing protein [Novispirillum itersonii]|uniref:DUF192 domain-containing protein n=1 Tax=Novispirillum itersonii TaxID=189 RepID=UPI000380926B|nr:DUF192 domain-containing protein [Novispirillum itersonii]